MAQGQVVGQPVMAQGQVVGQPVVVMAQQPVYAAGNSLQHSKPLLTGQFSSGVCDCFSECNSCLMAWCCPCFSYAQIISSAQIPTIFNDGAQFNTGLLVFIILYIVSRVIAYILAGVVGPSIVASDAVYISQGLNQGFDIICGLIFAYLIFEIRQKFRTKLQIAGDDCTDFMCAWCCVPCTIAQMDRHLAINEGNCSCSDPGPHPKLATIGQVVGTNAV
jgi:Cys-rich protein (TIGR01571 family)